MSTQNAIYTAATQEAQRAIRAITLEQVTARYPNEKDALRIWEAITKSHMKLQWSDDKGILVKTTMVIMSPLTVPILAVIWTAYRITWAWKWFRQSPDQREQDAGYAAYQERERRGKGASGS